MGAGELLFAVHPEGVIPDDPTAADQSAVLRDELEFGGIFVADSEPERAIGFENPDDFLDPLPGPVEVLVVSSLSL